MRMCVLGSRRLCGGALCRVAQELKSEFKDLTVWWKKVLGDEVASVRVTNRLTTTPCVVVAGKFGQSANMERIMRAQVRGVTHAHARLLGGSLGSRTC